MTLIARNMTRANFPLNMVEKQWFIIGDADAMGGTPQHRLLTIADLGSLLERKHAGRLLHGGIFHGCVLLKDEFTC